MTSPVTPDPSIHNVQTANPAVEKAGALASLNRLFTEIPRIIIDGAIAFIKEVTGIDLTGAVEFFDTFTSSIVSGLNGALDFVRAIMQPLVDAIIAILGPIPIIGTVIETLANFLGLTHTTANTGVDNAASAQYSADTANAGVAILNAKTSVPTTGYVFTDTFNRAAASNLGADYDRSMGSGSGTWGTDGSGNVVWTGGGSSSQDCMDRVVHPMTTDYQSISTVLTSPERGVTAPGTTSTLLRLCLRMDSAKNNYVIATVDGNGNCSIGYVLAGSYTQIGSTFPVTPNSGDLWEFRAGTSTSLYEFDLLQNNVTVATQTDSAHNSHVGIGSGYSYGALGVRAGTYVAFFATFQLEASTVQVLTVADRTP